MLQMRKAVALPDLDSGSPEDSSIAAKDSSILGSCLLLFHIVEEYSVALELRLYSTSITS